MSQYSNHRFGKNFFDNKRLCDVQSSLTTVINIKFIFKLYVTKLVDLLSMNETQIFQLAKKLKADRNYSQSQKMNRKYRYRKCMPHNLLFANVFNNIYSNKLQDNFLHYNVTAIILFSFKLSKSIMK